MLSVIDVESVVIAVQALLFATVWVRTGSAGMRWLAGGFALAAFWYLNSDRAPATGPDIDTPEQRLWAIVIGSAVLVVAEGMVRTIAPPGDRLRWLGWACSLPSLLLLALLAMGRSVPHQLFHLGGLLPYAGSAVVALRQARREPGDGHAVLGCALLLLPALPFILPAAGVPPSQLRYHAGVALAVFGMVVLCVTLLRRHRSLAAEVARRAAAEAQLREVNGTLESRVADRTASLHELVRGLEAFNQGVSHDLRGPLGGMAQLARMAHEALDQGDDAAARRALPAIARQCEASIAMVGGMLQLARLQERAPQRESVDLGAVARSALDEALLAAPAGARATFSAPEQLAVLADPVLLRMVLVNLIGNALKFARETAAPTVEVQARTEGADLLVSVLDNGIGFPPEVAARLFEPFYRAHGGRYEGHGLGLSIVRRAVEAMGGSVSAQAAPEGGARIGFRLPGAVPTPSPAATAGRAVA